MINTTRNGAPSAAALDNAVDDGAMSSSNRIRRYRIGTWIANEGLLRDEGTVCGLTGDEEGIRSKISAIEAFYEIEAVRADRDRGPLVARLEEARMRRAEARLELDEARAQLKDTQTAARKSGVETSVSQVLLRHSFTLLLAAVAAGCSYVVVHEALADDFSSPIPVAIAVVLGGSFTLFRPISSVFATGATLEPDGVQHAGGWRERAIELTPPFVASVFTCAHIEPTYSWGRIATTSLFLFALFFFSGKLALSTLAVVAGALEKHRAARRRIRSAREDLSEQTRLVAEAEERLRRLDEEEERAIAALAGLPDRHESSAICRYKIEVFKSEVAFARGAHEQYDLRDHGLPDDNVGESTDEEDETND